MNNLNGYALFSPLFRYPAGEIKDALMRCYAHLRGTYSAAAEEFEPYLAHMKGLDQRGVEELFLKTFEIQAICHLETGYVLFGEDYKRGIFLAYMKEEHACAAHECGVELPDHLSNVMELLPLLRDDALTKDIVEEILIPSIRRMLDAFDDGRILRNIEKLKKQHETIVEEALNFGNPYRYLLRALLMLLERDFPGANESTKERHAGEIIPIHIAEDEDASGCNVACTSFALGQGV